VVSASPKGIDLFFSIFPDALTASRVVEAARQYRHQHGLRGELQTAAHLHVTLQYIGHFDGVPERIVAKACDAAARVRMPPFAVMLHRVLSFSNKAGRYPLVLLGDDGVVGLEMLHGLLGAELRKVGLKARSGFTPHMTLIYGSSHRVGEQAVEPVFWTACEFVLVQSLIGKTKHVRLGQWPLHG
jgi:RNA 2',3'-cyclic 3'-phosphodiesterase